LPTELIDI